MPGRKIYRDIIKKIDLTGFPLPVKLKLVNKTLSVVMKVPDKDTNVPMHIFVTRPLISTKCEIEALEYIRWCIQESVLHELDECFKYNTRRVFDPHFNSEGRLKSTVNCPNTEWSNRLM